MAVPVFTKRQLHLTGSLLLFSVVFVPAALTSQEGTLPQAHEGLAPTPEPSASSANMEQILAEVNRRNDLRSAALHSYSAMRSYSVTDPKGKLHAEEVVHLEFRAPDTKSFTTVSEKGSALIRKLVLHRLMESEAETASGKQHHDSGVTAANYTFTLIGEEDLGPNHCFVLQAVPTRKDKYLFAGKVWIDANEYAIVQIAGRPAKRLSIWVDQADFVRRYQKIGEFWLPLKDETTVHVRFYGRKLLTIDHQQYTINDQQSAQLQPGAPSAAGNSLFSGNRGSMTRRDIPLPTR